MPDTERHPVTSHSSISILIWQVVIFPFFWFVFCGLYLNNKNREKIYCFSRRIFLFLTEFSKVVQNALPCSPLDEVVGVDLAGRVHRHRYRVRCSAKPAPALRGPLLSSASTILPCWPGTEKFSSSIRLNRRSRSMCLKVDSIWSKWSSMPQNSRPAGGSGCRSPAYGCS